MTLPIDIVPVNGFLVLGQQIVPGDDVIRVLGRGQAWCLVEIQPGATLEEGLGHMVVLVEVVGVGIRIVEVPGHEGRQVVQYGADCPNGQRSQGQGQGQPLSPRFRIQWCPPEV